MKNILSSKQIYDYFENVVIVAPSQDFKPLGPFEDPHFDNFIATEEQKCIIKWLFNGISYTKTIIFPHVYQIYILKLSKNWFIMLFHYLGFTYKKGNSLDVNFKHMS